MTGADAREAAARLLLPALRPDRDEDAEVRRAAERGLEVGVGGFVLFGGEAAQVRSLTSDLREAAGRPLWMASDLERGAGQQFAGAVELPPPAALARAPAPVEAARAAGRITGEEARRVGVDWALAPVLDLDVEPENPIVSTRSFGDEPERVARLGAAWIEGCQSAGVAACAKHYPGHGRTTSDSHLELPVVEASAETLEREDLAPYRAALSSGVASVMTAHVAYPALHPGMAEAPPPATYSRRLVTGLLREEMGFGGIVVTDALTMAGAGAEDASHGELAARALRAGCDMMLYPGDLEAAAEGLARRAAEEPEVAKLVRAARERVASARRRVVADPAGAPDEGPGARERRDREALRLAASSVTAVEAGGSGERGEAAAPGSGLDPSRPVELVRVSDDLERAAEDEPFGAAFAREMEALGWRVDRAPSPGPMSGADASAPTAGGRPQQRVVLLRSTPQAEKGRGAPGEGRLREVRRLLEAAPATALVVFGHERALRAVGRPGLCAWSTEGVMQRAAARRLDGAARDG